MVFIKSSNTETLWRGTGLFNTAEGTCWLGSMSGLGAHPAEVTAATATVLHQSSEAPSVEEERPMFFVLRAKDPQGLEALK